MPAPIAIQTSGRGTLKRPDQAAAAPPGAASPAASMQRAKLNLYDPAPAPGGSKPGAPRGSIDFQFNPKEVTITKSAKWERKTAKGAKTAGPPEFSGSDPCKLTVEMFFDATSTHDGAVVQAVEQLFSCCIPTEQSASQKKPSPPLVVLQWGAITSFASFVTSVSAKYTLFGSDGMPIRAVCNVSLEEMPGEPFRQNPTSGSYDVRRVHRTIAGDTLASIAFAEYGDPNQWRPLAAFNSIDDPMRMKVGDVLLLPTPEELAG